MNKRIFTVIGFFVISLGMLSSICKGQTISSSLISSSGDHFTGSSIQLSWTIGESVSETYSGTNAQLTQGFHQTNILITSITNKENGCSITAFPNPTTSEVTISTTSNDEVLVYSLLDNKGSVLQSQSFVTMHTLDLNALSQGIYYLKVENQKQHIQTFKIQKTN